ncbi:MAG: acyltransferase family protein, partial [Rhodocyclales bacterium]|nr:acyltransferase family protein [Rhodocyclales bacterium]
MQVLGTVTFTGNFVLWSQTGYFESAAELKPLLHVWSLAIEEQYYMLLPAALVFIGKRYWLPGILALTLMSLGLLIALGPSMPGAVFYLFPTRAWELGIGSLLALATLGLKAQQSVRYLALPAGAALLLVPALFPASRLHPEINALLVCLATAVLIAGNYRSLNEHMATRALARVGDISYSLYLVHWPIFAFLNNANVGGGGTWWPLRLGALLLSFILASLLYAQVEQRFRLTAPRPVSKKYVGSMVLLSVLLVAAVVSIEHVSRSAVDYGHRLRANVGFSRNCESKGDFVALPECRNAPDPTIVVWGDSFAMHLVPGIAATPGAKVMQATRSTCAPLLGFAFYNPPEYGLEWAKDCIRFNEEVLKTIAAMPSVKLVVLAGQGSYFLGGRAITMEGRSFVEKQSEIELASGHMRETVRALRSAGKRVVVIEPPPSQGFDIGRCIERGNEGKMYFGGPQDCRIKVDEYEARFARTLEFARQVGHGGYAGVYSFKPALCDAVYCETKLGDKIVFRDAGHFSYEGSIALADKAALVSELERLAW